MADDRDRNQGMRQGDTGAGAGQQGGSAQQAPPRNPQEGQHAEPKGDQQGGQKQAGNFDPNKGGDGGSYKEGGQNEQTRR